MFHLVGKSFVGMVSLKRCSHGTLPLPACNCQRSDLLLVYSSAALAARSEVPGVCSCGGLGHARGRYRALPLQGVSAPLLAAQRYGLRALEAAAHQMGARDRAVSHRNLGAGVLLARWMRPTSADARRVRLAFGGHARYSRHPQD